MTRYAEMSREELQARLQALAGDAGGLSPPAALRDSEARLRAILQTAVEGIVTIDERGLIESFNPAAERIFGWRAEEIVGQSVNRLMPAPFRHEHDQYLNNYLRTGRARIIGIGREVVGQRKDGTVFPMDLSVSEVRLQAGRLFTGFVRDITERKRLEQQILEISEVEQRRIGQGLHDGLCQHLAGIELMSQALARRIKRRSPAAATQAATLSEHLREAIAETRRLARGLSPVSVETNGLMSALQELTDDVAQLFRTGCRFHCPSPVLVRDHHAATHLYRIAQEAIHNAIRHGRAKTVTVALSRQASEARLTVTDDGGGLTEERQTGAGMGLHIMQYRARMIGASLDIRSAPGQGTIVTCAFNHPP